MTRTLKEIEALATVDPEFAAALEQAGGQLPDITQFTPEQIRYFAKQRRRQLAGVDSSILAHVYTEEIVIPARDQYPIPARVYRPASSATVKSPLLVIFHGGGHTLGDLDDEDLACRNYVKELGFVVVNVDYRLAPEHVFPTCVYDAWDAVQWVR